MSHQGVDSPRRYCPRDRQGSHRSVQYGLIETVTSYAPGSLQQAGMHIASPERPQQGPSRAGWHHP